MGKDSYAFVDFSHTPDSLQKALETLRVLKPSHKIISLFGCGGDRDKEKRPLMGEIAVKMSDKVFVTNDNPRSESPAEIARDILSGLKDTTNGKVRLELDRSLAIEQAIEEALRERSLLLIAGKGHEQTQEVESVKSFFSDQEEVKKNLKKWMNNNTSKG